MWQRYVSFFKRIRDIVIFFVVLSIMTGLDGTFRGSHTAIFDER